MECCDALLKNHALVYVEVIASFNLDGKITPHKIRWETGEVFTVDKIKSVQKAASSRGGGMATRYTVMVNGRETYLFRALPTYGDERIRWFVEAKKRI